MSILVVQLVPEGVLFGADRNVTTTVQQGALIASGQAQRPKVLKWPNREIVVGYVGRAKIRDLHTDEWLYASSAATSTPTLAKSPTNSKVSLSSI